LAKDVERILSLKRDVIHLKKNEHRVTVTKYLIHYKNENRIFCSMYKLI